MRKKRGLIEWSCMIDETNDGMTCNDLACYRRLFNISVRCIKDSMGGEGV